MTIVVYLQNMRENGGKYRTHMMRCIPPAEVEQQVHVR